MADPARAQAFGAVSDDYDRFRPGPTPAVLDWLLADGARDVVDMGAGTGALTRLLVERGLAVTAVEPDAGMRRVLAERVPGATLVEGTAEALPVPDASQDAVLGASMWHWVDPPRALAEIARVLRPGGRLGVLWTHPDREVDWVGELWTRLRSGQAARTGGDRALLIPPGVGFSAPEGPERICFTVDIDRDAMIGMAGTYSGHIVLSAEEQAARLREVGAALDAEPRLAGGATVALPMVSVAFRATRTDDSVAPSG
jgi:SAM-dependent methyltransferase